MVNLIYSKFRFYVRKKIPLVESDLEEEDHSENIWSELWQLHIVIAIHALSHVDNIRTNQFTTIVLLHISYNKNWCMYNFIISYLFIFFIYIYTFLLTAAWGDLFILNIQSAAVTDTYFDHNSEIFPKKREIFFSFKA